MTGQPAVEELGGPPLAPLPPPSLSGLLRARSSDAASKVDLYFEVYRSEAASTPELPAPEAGAGAADGGSAADGGAPAPRSTAPPLAADPAAPPAAAVAAEPKRVLLIMGLAASLHCWSPQVLV